MAVLYPTIEAVSHAISGLGTRGSQLEELVIYGVHWDRTHPAPTELLHFPSLRSLTIHWEWPPGLGCAPFVQFFSTLVLGEDGDSPSPLRDLTISGILDLDAPHMTTLLSFHKIGMSLTSLQVNLPPSLATSSTFEALPNTILSLCPALTRFLYFAWCPTSLLYVLPPRLQEFGVTIVHIAGLGAASLLTTIVPLIELVREARYRKGIQKLYIQWAMFQPPGAEKKLEDACMEVGVELSSVETSVVAGARPKVFRPISGVGMDHKTRGLSDVALTSSSGTPDVYPTFNHRATTDSYNFKSDNSAIADEESLSMEVCEWDSGSTHFRNVGRSIVWARWGRA
ncbi:hypothetical protein BDN72DRAFT_859223 [Pluteus cervinus]|uniref:Uncharacterized protein n=1 Tax=Pluteus cervinus TaxID=181527 RepID=A0ACD3ANK2_9AGAR|nr:hypothetical protein BDN72DRAFT_859223 [Pluteus cervinus]